jgi:hypothetical protein
MSRFTSTACAARTAAWWSSTTAFDCAKEIEFVARIYCQARMLRKPVVLTEEEMQKVIDKFTRHGQ